MAFPGSSIVPKKLVESGHDLNAKPVGSGPFKFVSYEPRTAIKFERNPDYFQAGKPYFDAMEYRIITDITALTNAVISGEVNFTNEIPAKDWAKVKSNPSLTALALEGSRYYWLLPNNTTTPLDNPKVRQAIGLALDRKALVAGRLLRPGHADPRRRRSRSGTGATPTPNSSAEGEPAQGQGSSWPRPASPTASRPAMTIASSFPAMVAMAPDHPGQPRRGRHQGQDQHDGDPALLGRGLGRRASSTSRPCTGCQPLADPDDFVTNNYKCGMAINVQKILQQGDGRHPGGGQDGAEPGRAQGGSTRRCRSSRSRRWTSSRWSTAGC